MSENSKLLYSANVKIFDFIESYAYLLALYKDWKNQSPQLTHRQLSAYLGFRSPNFFLLLTQKKRKLSVKTAKKLSQKFGHNKKEREYFILMIQLSLTSDLTEREEISKNMLALQRHSQQKNLEPQLYELYEHWYQVVLREIISLPFLAHHAQSLANFFDEKISPSQIQKGLEKLESLHLIEKQGQRWVNRNTHLKTGDSFSNTFISLFHQKMLDLAKLSLKKHTGKQRYLSTLTLPASSESETKLRELIEDFKSKALEISEQNPTQNDRVIQLNLQLFPLTKVANENS